MPTALPRHTVTETPEIAAILDRAAAHRPGMTRQQVLRDLILEAGRLEELRVEAERARLEQVLAETDPSLALGGDSTHDVRRMRDAEWG